MIEGFVSFHYEAIHELFGATLSTTILNYIIYVCLTLVADTFILQNCDVTSLSIGTIRVSCDSPHQIQVAVICADECNNFLENSNGYSPLTVRGLDPGKRYTVTIRVYDGNQAVLRDKIVTKMITVINTTSSKINDNHCTIYASSCV